MTADVDLSVPDATAGEQSVAELDPIEAFLVHSPHNTNGRENADGEISRRKSDGEPAAPPLAFGTRINIQFDRQLDPAVIDFVLGEDHERADGGGDAEPPDCIIWDIDGASQLLGKA